MGGDKHLAKKIIWCFNQKFLPSFKTEHLKRFYEHLLGHENLVPSFDTLGEEYAFFNLRLVEYKSKIPETKDWSNHYFSHFLYEIYSPSDL
ncbi:MAG: hypothetical protein ACOC1X_02510 [Promethearchaeota archaeon]